MNPSRQKSSTEQLQKRPDQQAGPEFRRINKTLEKRLYETKQRIFDVLGWPLRAPLSLMSWAQKKVQKLLPWLSQESSTSTPTLVQDIPEKPETVPVLSPEEAAERSHQLGIKNRFRSLYDGYRRSQGLQALEVDNRLNQLAQTVADQQASQRQVQHSSPEFREQQGIGGEIITAGFSTPEEALEHFVQSPEHERLLMSPSFQRMGIALKEGLMEKKDDKGSILAVQPVYYLVVVYDEHGKPVPESESIPRGPIPDDQRPQRDPDWDYITEACLDRPWLEKSFDMVQEQAQKAGIQISYNRELSEKPPSSASAEQASRFWTDRRGGSFFITLTKGDREQHYKVYDNPPQLLRESLPGEPYATSTVGFPDLIADFHKSTTLLQKEAA